jgi:hypothetical protein
MAKNERKAASGLCDVHQKLAHTLRTSVPVSVCVHEQNIYGSGTATHSCAAEVHSCSV